MKTISAVLNNVSAALYKQFAEADRLGVVIIKRNSEVLMYGE